MKNQIINTLIAVVFSVVSVFATSTIPSITSNGTKSFVIDSKVWKSNSVEVLIQDKYGITLYSKTQTLETSKTYNLENLKAGDYTITISNDIKSVENNITITKDGLIIDFNANTTFKPVFNILENNVDINFLSTGSDTDIYIRKDEQTLHHSSIKDALTINKRFDISNLPAGSYSVIVSNNNGSFVQNFTK